MARLSPFELYVIDQLREIKSILESERVVVIKVECCCPKPPPVHPGPAAPRVKLERGDTVTMIRYPFTITVPSDATATSLSFTENGGPSSTVSGTQNPDGTYGGNFEVNDGSKVEYWANCKDAAGNPSLDSAHGIIDSAADTVPPAAPTVSVGAGDTAPVAAPVLGRGVKVK